MLENLYKQGIRTPSTEQIQQITSRLRAYGHIEGKNVFYWFQNHKARQRQKLMKQQTIAYSNRFLRASHPICQNGWFTHNFIIHFYLSYYVFMYYYTVLLSIWFIEMDLYACIVIIMVDQEAVHMIISGIQQLWYTIYYMCYSYLLFFFFLFLPFHNNEYIEIKYA